MIKLIICVKRKPGMDLAEFHNYWREVHGGLYRNLPFISNYVRKYNQCHTAPEAYENNVAPYDGVAELWFDNYQSINDFLADPEYLAKVRPDEKKFCDFEKMIWFATEEESIIS